MNVETCQFIRASSVFKKNKAAWETYVDSLSMTLCNDNSNAILLMPSRLLERSMVSIVEGIKGNSNKEISLRLQCSNVLDTVNKIPHNVFIDLMN